MGFIKETKIANNNVQLEIIYGGREAPFGGIDSSMPPSYIDPKCAVDIQGFVIIDNQLVCVALQPLDIDLEIPSGSAWDAPLLSGFGNFYTEANGYQNFILLKGADETTVTENTMNLALYVWPSSNNPGTLAPTAVLSLAQGITTDPGSPAVAILGTEPGHVFGILPIAQISVILTQGATVETYGPFTSADTPSVFCAAIVAAINGLPSVLVTAALGPGGTSVVLTTINNGVAQNNTQLTISVSPSGAVQFPGVIPYVESEFQGGTDEYTYPSGIGLFPLSFVSEGEQLILGGPGTAILTYNNEVFSVLTQYLGANVLKKFGGSLLALGITPSPGTVIQSPEMVFAWSAASEFGVWNPTTSDGLVTGAGFEQLADIEDPLTGGFVNSSTLLMLRAKGMSYAVLTGNGTEPFQVSHVDLAPEGEGCQGQLLSSQYGPVGFYVGNSNIYSYIQNPQPIGDKIKTFLYENLSPAINSGTVIAASKAVSVFLLNTESTFFGVFVYPYLYFYNANNGTWTRLFCVNTAGFTGAYAEDFPVINTSSQFAKQSQFVLGTFKPSDFSYNFSVLAEQVPNIESLTEEGPLVYFPNEEISFGRDITIDSIYASMAGSPGQELQFIVVDIYGNVLLNTIFTFPVGASYDAFANYAIFDNITGTAFTGQAPQLQIIAAVNGSDIANQLRIAKICMYGSYDPMQRPT